MAVFVIHGYNYASLFPKKENLMRLIEKISEEKKNKDKDGSG